jgi:Ca-activated chloride channel homolog
LEQIFHDIDKLEKTTVAVKKYQQYRDLFPACIMAGCGLLVAQILLSQTIWKKLP